MALENKSQIGMYQEELTPLEELGLEEPQMEFFPEAGRVTLSSRRVQGVGGPMAVWRWGFLRQEDRDLLRLVFEGLPSHAVYIESQTNEAEDSFAQFQATAVWPEGNEGKEASKRLGFELRFTGLVEVAPL